MRTRALKTIYASGALLLATVLAGCGGNDSASTGDGGDDLGLISAGTLTVCSDIPYKPFEYEEGGQYTGFDMDLVREIAGNLDLEMKVQDVGFDGLQSGAVLAAGQCDMAASAMTITEEREENLDFSEAYYDSKQSLLAPTGSGVTSIDDLVGKKVGVQQGTTGAAYAQENVPDGVEVVSFPSDAELYPAIQSGSVDAVLQDLPVNLDHTEGGKFEIVQEFDTDEQYGFAVKEEGKEALLEAINEELSALRDSGKYQELYDKYFKVD
ncbi:basic amino acid ABC transporter substrate-binding protein [Nocardioides pakistanensis]